MISAVDVITDVEQYGAPAIVAVFDGLCGCGKLLEAPLDALLRLAGELAKAITAKNELEAMRAAVKSADAGVDLAEAAAGAGLDAVAADAAAGR